MNTGTTVSVAGLRAIFQDLTLGAPVSMGDLDDLRSMALAVYDDHSIEVVLHGTPDRKCDGAHRVEITVGDTTIALPVTTAA